MGPATSCRPHSHRRVVFSSGKPSEERLASDVSPPNKSADFVTGARAGIRFRSPAVSILPGRSPSALHLPSFGTETDHPLMACLLKRLNVRPKSFIPPRWQTECPVYPVEKQSRSPQTTSLASGLTLLHVWSQRPRGQFPSRRNFWKTLVKSTR